MPEPFQLLELSTYPYKQKVLPMKSIVLLAAILLLFGCTMRMAAYAPHRIDNADHRNALSNNACLDCHDVVGKREHKADDNCMRCHRIVRGG